MRYRALVQSDRTEDVTCESFTAACEAALDLSVEFGYVDVRRNAPRRVLVVPRFVPAAQGIRTKLINRLVETEQRRRWNGEPGRLAGAAETTRIALEPVRRAVSALEGLVKESRRRLRLQLRHGVPLGM